MSIVEKVAAELIAQGWVQSKKVFVKEFATGGAFGKAYCRLRFSEPSQRYLERVDGWDHVERDVDLRNYENDPAGAVAAVMKGA